MGIFCWLVDVVDMMVTLSGYSITKDDGPRWVFTKDRVYPILHLHIAIRSCIQPLPIWSISLLSLLRSPTDETWKIMRWVLIWNLKSRLMGMRRVKKGNGKKWKKRREKNLMINDAEPVSWFFFLYVYISSLWSPHAFFSGSYSTYTHSYICIERKYTR